VEVLFEGGNPVLGHSCTGRSTGAEPVFGDPALRIQQVVSALGPNGHFNEGEDESGKEQPVTICSEDFGPALRLLGKKIVAKLAGCLSAPLMTGEGALACARGDLLTGTTACQQSCLDQANCQVEERAGSEPARVVPRCAARLFDPAIVKCSEEPCPCWRILPSKDCKPARDGSPYTLSILRGQDPKKGTMASIQCSAATERWGDPALGLMSQCSAL